MRLSNILYKSFYSGRPVRPHNYLRRLAFKFLDLLWRSIKLHINNRCNLHCRNCYYSCSGEELGLQEIFSLLDQLKALIRNRSLRLDILGGEPLMRKDLFDIIDYAKHASRIKRIHLFTNGTLIDDEKAVSLKKAGLDVAIVTLHSHDFKVHDGQTGIAGSWEKTVKGIENCLKAGISTYSFTIPTRDNADDLRRIESFVTGMGAKTIYFPYIRLCEDDSLYIHDRGKFHDTIDWIFSKSIEHRRRLIEQIAPRSKVCSAFVKTVSIKSDGTVTPCAFVDMDLGNIRQKKLYRIINDACLNKELIDFLCVPQECRKCSAVKMCGGGCKAFRYAVYRDTSGKDANCRGPYKEKVALRELGRYLPYFY